MHFVYILYSKARDRYYVGESAFLEERLFEHNNRKYKAAFTTQASDWEVFLSIDCKERSHALQIERKIKSMKSRVYIENLKKYPEMIEKLKTL